MAEQTKQEKADEQYRKDLADQAAKEQKAAEAAKNEYSVETNSGAYPQPGAYVGSAPTSDYVGVADDQTPSEAAQAAARGKLEQTADNLEAGLGVQEEGKSDSDSKGAAKKSASSPQKDA